MTAACHCCRVQVHESLRSECAALVSTVQSLVPADLGRDTRCDWNVKTLLGHIVKGLERAAAMVETPCGRAPDPDPLIYYRSAARSDPRRSEVRMRAAHDSAARFESAAEMADALQLTVLRVIEGSERLGPDAAVAAHWGPIMRLEDYLATRVVEVAVHGLDVADAIGRQPWLTPAASHTVTRLLLGLLDTELPEGVRWSGEVFIRCGTGRRELSSLDRATLGELAPAFPLLS